MSKKITFALIFAAALAVALVAIVGTKVLQFKVMGAAEASTKPPSSTISTFTAEKQNWGESLRAVGSIQPVQGVALEAEASGIVKSIDFTNGQRVQAGDLLVQLDIDVEKAQLKAAEATAKLAALEYERAKRLRESGNVPQSQLDSAVADLDKANADVENIKAVIDRKTVTAPFDGRVGIRQINLGQFVPQGAPIVALQSYDKVYVNFTLPQQALSRLEVDYPVTLETDAFPGREFEGQITALSPEIDPVTRTIEVQGTLDNPEGLLRAGLFVRVRIILPVEEEVLVVPATAILYAPFGNSVYKVLPAEEGEGLIAKQFFVRLGRTQGDYVSILEGVEDGDAVVSAGAFKLRNNTPVNIDNENTPKPKLAPKPANS
ncbi:efflux RND transporter periplasmic adaptor subunit [Coraliomargarita parva]|uniref:efflux RND transporter periplasmic adaptor subunit n=1 Tax=Coraliomargarita parva TaxID=3014050 RepID=UPI0022B58F78|nr:efflux RND transporter periplasmic adaptor subunit [Coraliomargarita parva]